MAGDNALIVNRMAFYPDLSVYRYLHDPVVNGTALNVGWLDRDHAYTKGVVSIDILRRVFEICTNLQGKTRGYHQCQFCSLSFLPSGLGVVVRMNGEKLRLGSAEMRVEFEGKIFVAPNMILHYMKSHKYLPPPEFINAVMVRSGVIGNT